MQLLGLYARTARTLSLATHDPELTTKEFAFTRHDAGGDRAGPTWR